MRTRKSKAGKRKKRKSAVRKIYKTTDGYLSGRADIKKRAAPLRDSPPADPTED